MKMIYIHKSKSSHAYSIVLQNQIRYICLKANGEPTSSGMEKEKQTFSEKGIYL